MKEPVAGFQPSLGATRRQFWRRLSAAGGAALVPWPAVRAAEAGRVAWVEPVPPLIEAPLDPAAWPAFREALQDWRARARRDYTGAAYDLPEFAWAARCFCCGFVLVSDQAFYDPGAATYRLGEFLDEAQREFGGFDALVLWHAYPRLGVDERNQFDFYRDLPGGILGVRDLARACRARGVRVFLDYNPWDTGTRREPRGDEEVLTTLIQALEADGLFLDTLERGAEGFRARLDAARPGVVLESELALPLEGIADHHLSWGQGFKDSSVPGVLRNKWFEPRHLQHQIRRWDSDHTAELHTAWMNGSGMLVWENVFGSWVGWSPRDRSLLRSMLPIQRRYAGLFTSGAWTPLVPVLAANVYASEWEQAGLRVWTLVNRSEREVSGPLLEVDVPPEAVGHDLVRGEALVLGPSRPGRVTLTARLPARGVGALALGLPRSFGPDFEAFQAAQRLTIARADASTAAARRSTQLNPPPAVAVRRRAPAGMVAIPATEILLRSELRARECGCYESASASDPRTFPSYEPKIVTFERRVRLRRYAVDLTPVTNAQFAQFLARSGYRPRHPENFLKHWGHGHAPAGQEDHPVVYVSLEDARAYAGWAGKRLPTEEEWQYAAAGPEARRYPWGNALEPGRCNDGSLGLRTTAVQAFPRGRSPWGVYDLCGNVWEWTESERSDGRTRFCLLKGGTYYRARGSHWYFDGGPQANPHAAKFLLCWPGLDRCATVGFRCVAPLR